MPLIKRHDVTSVNGSRIKPSMRRAGAPMRLELALPE
jgi:hypothetical protein